MAMHASKRGVQLLLSNVDFQRQPSITVNHVWDVITTGDEDPSVLAENLFGTEDEVIRLAQEAFGVDTEHPSSYKWELVPSRVEMNVVDAAELLSSLRIEHRRIPNTADIETEEAKAEE